MEIQDILSLVEAVSEHGLTELKLNDGKIKLSLKKEESRMAAAGIVQNAAAVLASGGPGFSGAAAGGPGMSMTGETEIGTFSDISPDQIVTSPLVGTFYSSSSPEAEAFVKVGDTVKKGQVLGIIEAMKLMNEIESDYDGVVEAVLVKNEDVVEYGQPLFRIH